MKLLTYINTALILALLIVTIVTSGGQGFGGVSNYDSLHLRPSSSSDNALEVENSDGTDRLVVTGAGVITLSGATTISGAATFSSTLTATGETQLSTLVHGGSALTLATSSPTVATAAQVCNNSVITQPDWDDVASSTWKFTLPSVTTLYADCLDTQGDIKEFMFINNASAAASTTQIIGGTNIVLTESDNGADADVLIGGGTAALIKLIRVGATATSSGIYAHVEEIRDAD